MTSREGARERGRNRGAWLLQELRREWREQRLSAGLTQRAVGRAIGLSREAYGRVERGAVADVGLATAARISAALGTQLSVKAFPLGAPIRDAAHIELLTRFELELAPAWRRRRESPIAGEDRRAWDLRLDGPVSVGVEAETRPRDLQALQRRMNLKQRDSGVQRMILLVAGTRQNRARLRELLPVLRGDFPLGTREMLDALRRGIDPGANGIVVI
jgi:transcriptional regulator with XRE-family HTH domain